MPLKINRKRHVLRNRIGLLIDVSSMNTIPPQIQMEIASRKKVITDEHSGRILVDSSLAEEEKEKMEKLFAKM